MSKGAKTSDEMVLRGHCSRCKAEMAAAYQRGQRSAAESSMRAFFRTVHTKTCPGELELDRHLRAVGGGADV